jgi:hypothetical protein
MTGNRRAVLVTGVVAVVALATLGACSGDDGPQQSPGGIYGPARVDPDVNVNVPEGSSGE